MSAAEQRTVLEAFLSTRTGFRLGKLSELADTQLLAVAGVALTHTITPSTLDVALGSGALAALSQSQLDAMTTGQKKAALAGDSPAARVSPREDSNR